MLADYTLGHVLFEEPHHLFKSFLGSHHTRRKTFFITIYSLDHFDSSTYSFLCSRMKFICRHRSLFRCCDSFFDHNLRSLHSVRPMNIGFMIHQFIVVEPIPMVSLADSAVSNFPDFSVLVNGLCSIAKTVQICHGQSFGYGSLSLLNIVVCDGSFELRPPPLFPFLPVSSAPPPCVDRPFYREVTDERFCGLFTEWDCMVRDAITFAKLLCEFGVYGGRSLWGDFASPVKLLERLELPPIAVDLLRHETDMFLDSEFESQIRGFFANRRSMLDPGLGELT
jgi:hypothetical protein